jgi:hypothetical protein
MRLGRAVIVVVSLALACNAVLGIEEGSPKPVTDDAAPPLSDAADAPDVNAGAPSTCKVDADCVPPNGCYTGRCDVVVGACAYLRCETKGKACSAGTCTAKLTCAADHDYGFRATSYKVDAALGCKGNAQACVAAAFPFLIVGTTTDTLALVVDDMVAAAATKIPIVGLGFRPAQIVTSGRRVWVVGELENTGGPPPYQLHIASIDIPSDPTTTALQATSTALTYPFVTYTVLPAPNGSVYFAFNDVAQGFPTALLASPLPSSLTLAAVSAADAGALPAGTIPMFRQQNAPGGASLVASSGGRLLLHRFAAQLVNLVNDPATPKVAMGQDLPLVPGLPAYVAPRFSQGTDGTVFLNGPVSADAPPPDCNCGAHQRLQWMLPNAVATAADVNQVVDVAAYVNPQVGGGMCHQCNGGYVTLPSVSTWIDARTVLIASPANDPDRTLTDTRVVTRDPLSTPPARQFKTAATDVPTGNFAVDRIALTSSAGLGYEIITDSEGNNMTLSIIDPQCDAK